MASVVFKAFNTVQATGTFSLFKSHRDDYKHGEQKRDFVYVKDCTDIMWWLLKSPSTNGIFNVGSGAARTWNDLLTAIFASVGAQPNITYIDMPESLRNQYQYFTEAPMQKLKAAGYSAPLTALEAGYSPQEIMDHIKTSDDPTHKEWYSTYSANMADRNKEQTVGSIYYNNGGEPTETAKASTAPVSSVGTPLLDAAKQLTPAELIGTGVGLTALVKAPGLYNAAQERKLDKQKIAIEERRIKAYEAQVGKQGMAPEPMTPTTPEAPKLSPLEEARINTERARAEAIQQKIALEERRVAALEARTKALAEAKTTKAPSPQGPVIQLTPNAGVAPPSGPVPVNPPVALTTEVGAPPKDMGLVKAGTANTVKNQIAEEAKVKEEPLKPVAPPKAAPKPKLDMPEGWGKGMTWLVNQHGVEGAQAFIDAKNNGKPFATYDEMMKSYQENTMRPKFSDIPKDVRKSRGISKAIVPPTVPSGMGMGVQPPIGGGGRLNETGRPGEEIIHNLNPLKL
jgi:hypothetical protein